MLADTYLSEAIRLRIINGYLLHEHRKLKMLNSRTHKKIIKYATDRLFKSGLAHVKGYLAAENPREYADSLDLKQKWVLFHNVSYGLFFKELWLCVGHPKFDWSYEEKLPLNICVIETKVGGWESILQKHPTFAEAWYYAERHKDDVKKMVEQEYIFSGNGCDRSPIIGYKTRAGILVHDGNGRVLKRISSIISKNDTEKVIPAFVGEPVRIPDQEDRRAMKMLKKEVFLTKRWNFGYKTETLWYDKKNLASQQQ